MIEQSLQEQRRRAKDALVDVGLALTSTLELSEVLERVVKAITEVMDADRASIWLLDESRQELMAAAIYGLDPYVADQWKGRKMPWEAERLSYEVIRSGCPVAIDDAESHPLTDKDAVRMFTDKSILVVPLVWKGQTLGSLFLNYVAQQHHFTEEEIALTVALANQAAVALQNARLYSESQRKEEALQRSFRQIGAALVSSTKPDEILRLTTEVAVDLMGASLCLTHLRCGDSGELTLRAAAGVSWDARHGSEFEMTHSLQNEVIGRGMPLRVDDLGHGDGGGDVFWLRRFGLHCFVGMPLVVDGTPIGVLSAYRNEPRPFAPEEVELLSFLVKQAGAALKSASLAAETMRRAEELELIHEASAAINSSLNPTEVLSVIAETAKRLTDADVASIFVRGLKSGQMVQSVAVPPELGYPATIRTRGLTWHIMQRGEIITVDDTASDERVSPSVLQTGMRSVLGVPLKVEQEIVGVLYLNSRQPGHFRTRGVTLLRVLANHIAVALKNAHLFNDMLQEKEKFASVFNNSSDGVLLIDADHRIAAMNPALERLTGWTAGEAVGRSCEEILRCIDCSHEMDHEAGCPLLLPMTGGRSVPYFETALLTKRGVPVQVAASFSQIPDPVNGVVGVSIIRDVTELKRIEEAKSDFISIVSHELRTPLSLVKGYASTILQSKREFDAATQQRFVSNIDQAADRMTRLVNDLLSVSRIETGKLDLKRQDFDLGRLIAEVVEEEQLTTSMHRLVAELPEEPLSLNGDPARIQQILTNLLRNAIMYSPKGGTVTVSVRLASCGDLTGMLGSRLTNPRCALPDRPAYAIIAVKDQGIGLTDEQKRHIFEKFFRAERGLTRSTSGLGLGLFIARGLVEAHGGYLWVESELNEGSSFFVAIPLLG